MLDFLICNQIGLGTPNVFISTGAVTDTQKTIDDLNKAMDLVKASLAEADLAKAGHEPGVSHASLRGKKKDDD